MVSSTLDRPIITVTTDLGRSDSYVAQIKGVILGINPRVQLVDLIHDIPAQDVSRAAAVLDEAVDAFPEGTIHLVVVDPGVGSERQLVGVELGRWRFVAPNNGALATVARRFPLVRCIRLTNESFWRQPVSNTFHGRDIMGPMAAHWSLGTDLTEFGEPLDQKLVDLPVRLPKQIRGGIEGEIIRQDSFGNLITNIDESMIPSDFRDRVVVEVGSRLIVGVHRYYGQGVAGTLLALFGSSGRLEIAVNKGNAKQELRLSEGETVRVLGFQTDEER